MSGSRRFVSRKWTHCPFNDAEFGVVLNRHSAFNCAEVARVLAPGGTFLTQQVHGRSAEELQAAFGAEPLWPDASPDRYVPRLAEAGLDIVNVLTWTGHVTFTDVGALVYYLRAVPWLVPGFSVATHVDSLLRLQHRLDAGEAALTFPTRLYLIEAKRGLDQRTEARRIVAEGYDRIAETYAAWSRSRVVDEARPRYASVLLASLPPGARLLELGCGGGGPSTRQLAERFVLTASIFRRPRSAWPESTSRPPRLSSRTCSRWMSLRTASTAWRPSTR